MRYRDRSFLLWLFALLMAMPGTCAGAQGTDDARALLQKGLGSLDASRQSKTRFTYLYRDHLQNFDKKGRLRVEYTRLYDVTYLSGLEYQRLIEENGKPLAGKALAAEQERYDDAVRERAALDDTERAKIARQELVNTSLDLQHLLTEYRNTVTGHETVDGHDCTVIDAEPLSTPAAHTNKSYRLWVDAETGEILRTDFKLLIDEGAMQRGATGSGEWKYIDGSAVMTRMHIEFTALDSHRKPVRVVADHQYSRFQRFGSESKIVPDGE